MDIVQRIIPKPSGGFPYTWLWKNMLNFGKSEIYLLFRSLIRTFAPDFEIIR